MSPPVEVIPVEGLPDISPGDDLAELLVDPLRDLGARHGDIVAVTSKIVSKAEGRLVAGTDRAGWVEKETRRLVARRGELIIAETRHGFVCANAGVDASNLEAGVLALLPEDPDASALALREGLALLGLNGLAVVITDTFGRPWRQGLVNVAIGCSGMPALIDLRGQADHTGRELEATIVALADEVAAATGLVMGKAARVPVALVRGVGLDAAPPGSARDLIRDPEEDLFREAPLLSISSRRGIRSFGAGEVSREAVQEAVRAACAAPSPRGTKPWRFTALSSPASKRTLVVAMSQALRTDLERDGVPQDDIAARLSASDALLATASVLIVPWVSFARALHLAQAERDHAEKEMFLLSAGAAIQSLLLALHAQGLASCWTASSIFCQDETRAALAMPQGWFALGVVAVGRMPEGGAPGPRPPVELDDFFSWR